MVSKEKPKPKLYPHRDTVFAVLKLFGISRFTVLFSGADKSGEITEVNECKGLLDADQLVKITWSEVAFATRHLSQDDKHRAAIDEWFIVSQRMNHGASLQGFLTAMCYDMLERMCDDWRYGEGSSGSIIISTVRKSIKLDLDENIITTKNYKIQL